MSTFLFPVAREVDDLEDRWHAVCSEFAEHTDLTFVVPTNALEEIEAATRTDSRSYAGPHASQVRLVRP